MIYKIKDLCDINTVTLKNNHNLSYIDYLDTANLNQGSIDTLQRLQFGVDSIPSRAKRVVRDNDILFSTVRPNQLHYGFISNPKKNLICSTGFAVLTPKDNIIPYYLYKYLTQKHIIEYLQGIAETSTSTYPSIKPSDIGELDIDIPSLAEQKSIANILSPLDDKIELNNKINKNLEELAQTLYKRWFVDFEFPNEYGEPYKSSGGKMVDSELGLIPKGWEISNLLDIADYLNGLAVKKFAANDDELSLPVLKIKELGIGNVTAESDRCNLSVPEKYIIKKGDLIFSWSGTLLVDFWTGSKSVLNQHLFKVSSTKYPRWFYYFWTKYHLGKFQNIAKSMATTMGHIKREDLSKSQVFIPIKDLLEQGSSIFEPIIDQILKLRIQNNKLMKVRDELLPKLMNGEIEVPIEE